MSVPMGQNTSDILVVGMGGWIENTSDKQHSRTNKVSRAETGRYPTERRTSHKPPVTSWAVAADQKTRGRPRQTRGQENDGRKLPNGLMREVQFWHPQFQHPAPAGGSPRQRYARLADEEG
ncbi:hypothetical protein Hte_004434 [Hypoxylon texense]